MKYNQIENLLNRTHHNLDLVANDLRNVALELKLAWHEIPQINNELQSNHENLKTKPK